jgi:gliding motility-associated-like protein
LLKTLLISFLLLAFVSVSAQAPVAEFSATPIRGCAPLTVSFKDLSSGNPTSWNWEFGNGQLSGIQNPVVTYMNPGVYSVTLVVRNALGLNGQTKTGFIIVDAAPVADFVVDRLSACAPGEFRFTDQSSSPNGSITSWSWDFGDGTASSQQSPTHAYSTPGFYTITLTVTSSSGCTATAQRLRYLRVVSGVEALFDTVAPPTCAPPFQTTFKNETSGPGNLTYRWDFGDGQTSTDLSPIINYAAQGTYNVRLIANSDFGCADTIDRAVTINGVSTSFTSPDSVCFNSPITFQSSSSEPASATIWDFGDGTTSTGESATHTFAAPGVYPVKMVNRYARCSDSLTRTITVLSLPNVSFNSDRQSGCQPPLPVTFSDNTPNAAQWSWQFGDGETSSEETPTHVYSSFGEYNVRLSVTDRFGCSNSLESAAFVKVRKPVVTISNAPAGLCAGGSFTPVVSVETLDPVTGYTIDFGDGTIVSGSNFAIPHTYSTVGNYTLKVVVITQSGCRDSAVIAGGISVGTPATVDFTAAPTISCAGAPVQFTSQATGADSYLWQFGDNASSTDVNPVHSYQDTGAFTVTLTAYNNGCPATNSKTSFIQSRPPVAAFSDAPLDCAGTTMRFTNESAVDPVYGPVSYEWTFGLGLPSAAISTSENPDFTFAGIGKYDVRLVAVNGSCRDTTIQQVQIVNEVADFTLSKSRVCRNEPFTVSAKGIAENIVSYTWFLNSDPVAAGREAMLSVPSNGTYSLSLTIQDINGCESSINFVDTLIVGGPVAIFQPVPASCAGAPVQFVDQTSSVNPITNWRISFGDGTSRSFTAPPFTHQYTDSGTFVATFAVTDNVGCSDSMSRSIQISKPVARFSKDTTLYCAGAPIQFTDSSAGNNLSWQWSFGDGATSNLQNPLHVYSGADRDVTVKLKVVDAVGCEDSIELVNYIRLRSPKAAFSLSDSTTICPPFETNFTFQGADYESFVWDFGDGSEFSSLDTPRHFYNTYDTFVAKLYVFGYGGCVDSAERNIYVMNPSGTNFTYNPVAGCNRIEVDFTIEPPPYTRFLLYFGDGALDSMQQRNITHEYSSPGRYSPIVYIIDSTGCEAGLGGAQLIEMIGAIPLFAVDNRTFCDSGTVAFNNFTIGNDPIVLMEWDFGDGTTSTELSPAHTYTRPGTYFPTLTVATQSGCTDFLRDTIRVYQSPITEITSPDRICINAPAAFNATLLEQDTAAIQFNWNFGDGETSVREDASKVYRATGTYNVTLTTTVSTGCTFTRSKTVEVLPLPVIEVVENPVTNAGTAVAIPVNFPPGIATYNWTPARDLSCYDCPNPFARPRSTTTYKVVATDSNGCTSSADVTVFVLCNENNLFVPNTFSPNGDGTNDVFYPRGRGIVRVQSFNVFNRWGQKVFEKRNFTANDKSAGWNGTVNGQPASSDVYVYSIEIICENSETVSFKGNVMLLR